MSGDPGGMRSAVKSAPADTVQDSKRDKGRVVFDETPITASASFSLTGSFVGSETSGSPSPRVLQYEKATRSSDVAEAEAVLGATWGGEGWTPPSALAGIDFDPESLKDDVKGMKVLEMLQSLDRTEEELMGQKLSNEELIGFLEMGERRIVDLAVKVKLLEDQNDRMASREIEQSTQLDQLKISLSAARQEQQRLESLNDTLTRRIEAVDHANEELLVKVNHLEAGRLADSKQIQELTRNLADTKAAHSKEKEDLEVQYEKRVQSLESQRRAKEHANQALTTKIQNLQTAFKKSEQTASTKAITCDRLNSELKTLKESAKSERTKLEAELNSFRVTHQEEFTRLQTWEKELSETADRLKKTELELRKDEVRLKKVIGDAFSEIKDLKSSEEHALMLTKKAYEEELSLQFEEKQEELERHWREKEAGEIEQLEARRAKLEEELKQNVGKVNDSRKRLESYSRNLERYGANLKREYEEWKLEKEQVYQVVEEAQQERQDLEAAHRRELAAIDASMRDIRRELEGKDCIIASLQDQIDDLKDDLRRSDECREESERIAQELRRGKADLTAENSRLVEDNALLEKCFSDLKGEHEQTMEEMNYMKNREEEERELRRKANDMLLASYKVQVPQVPGVMAVPRDGTKAAGGSKTTADVVCWDCHEASMDAEKSNMLQRAKEARGQLKELTTAKAPGKPAGGKADMFIKAHMLDAERLEHDMHDARAQQTIRKDTALLTAERKSQGAVAGVAPARTRHVDPDVNPPPPGIGIITPAKEAMVDSSRRRKRDLVYLKSMYPNMPKHGIDQRGGM